VVKILVVCRFGGCVASGGGDLEKVAVERNLVPHDIERSIKGLYGLVSRYAHGNDGHIIIVKGHFQPNERAAMVCIYDVTTGERLARSFGMGGRRNKRICWPRIVEASWATLLA